MSLGVGLEVSNTQGRHSLFFSPCLSVICLLSADQDNVISQLLLQCYAFLHAGTIELRLNLINPVK